MASKNIHGEDDDEDQPLMSSAWVSSQSSSNDCLRSNEGIVSVVLCTILAIFVLVGAIQSAFIVEPGAIGIVVTLGHVTAVQSGMHFRLPFVSELEKLTAKTQLLDQENIIPTKEGLAVKLNTAVLYRLESKKAAQLYTEVGPNYVDVLLVPETASAVRGLTSESEAKALYSSGRSFIQSELKKELESKFKMRGIIIEDVLLRDIELPEELTRSIELKVQAEQDAARMEFVLKKEKREAERKAIEAQGVADFQRIVSDGISEELLKWKGVEATELFAQSPNTKIVLIGNAGDGLPVILGGDTSSSSTN